MLPRITQVLAGISLLALVACDEGATAPRTPLEPSLEASPNASQVALVRQLATDRGIGPFAAPAPVRTALVDLGRALAFDPVLSGNRNIACTTCHLPKFATGDGKSLSVGEGGIGFGPIRAHPSGVFIPRNAPPLFNLGAMKHLFWDGRVAVDEAGRIHTPAGSQLTPAMEQVFEFGAISALAMFPVTNRAEMRGTSGNELAALADDDMTGIWAGLMARLGEIPQYRGLFAAAYPNTPFEDMTFAHASNAIAGFLVEELTFTKSPWDRFLAGNDRALSDRQLAGAETFLTLRCSVCHNGATLSDDEFHNVAIAQVGPGQGNGPSLRDDFGRMNVTGDVADLYRFRTSPLRNVELTAPYGHDGSIPSLREFIEHYSESHLKLEAFDGMQLEPALHGTLVPNVADVLATRDPLLEGVVLTPDIVDRLMDFMLALTDDRARRLEDLTPSRVPSRLEVDRP